MVSHQTQHAKRGPVRTCRNPARKTCCYFATACSILVLAESTGVVPKQGLVSPAWSFVQREECQASSTGLGAFEAMGTYYIQVALLSGKSVQVAATPDCSLSDVKVQAQDLLHVGSGVLRNTRGYLLHLRGPFFLGGGGCMGFRLFSSLAFKTDYLEAQTNSISGTCCS